MKKRKNSELDVMIRKLNKKIIKGTYGTCDPGGPQTQPCCMGVHNSG